MAVDSIVDGDDENFNGDLLTPDFDADTRTYDVEVVIRGGFHHCDIGCRITSGGGTRTLKSLTGADGGRREYFYSYGRCGQDQTFVAMVDHGVRIYTIPRRPNTSTGEYRINVMREKPKLDAAGADAAGEGTGLKLRYGLGQTGETGDSALTPESGSDPVSVFGLNKMYSPDTLAYKAAVPYQHTTVTLHAMAGMNPPSDTIKVNWVSPTDANDGVIGHQVDLSDDVPDEDGTSPSAPRAAKTVA